MVLAFDGRAFCRQPDSITRVLRILVCAAQQAGWQIEIWIDGPLQPDAETFRELTRPVRVAGESCAVALWSPDIDVLPCTIPAIATLHDVNPLLPDGRNYLARRFRQRRFRQRVRASLARIDRLVTDTQDAKQRVVEAFPDSGKPISVVPLFADQGIRPLRGPAGEQILRQLGLRPGFILFVGSLRRHKNWDGLLRAYATLPPALQTAHPLVFAGRAKRVRGQAEHLSNELGVSRSVHILGSVDENTLHALYGAAGLLACPSYMEGFGFPPLEAMACGVPVVASNRTCLPEVLGSAAFYVDPDSTTRLAEGLTALLMGQETREKLIEAGFRQAALYNPRRTAEAMTSTLAEMNI